MLPLNRMKGQDTMKNTKDTTPFGFVRKVAVRAGAAVMALALSACLVPASVCTVSASKLTDSKVESYQSQIRAIESQMAGLKTKMTNAASDMDRTIAEKEKIDREVTLLIQKIDLTNSIIAELSAGITEKNSEIADKEAAYAAKYALFKQRLRVSREDGQTNYLEMLFGASSLSDFLSRVDRIGAMLEYDVRIMRELQTDKSDLESVRSLYNTQKAEQEAYLASLRADEAELEKKRRESENYINRLESDRAYYITLYEKALAAEEQLQKELQAYLKELEAKQNNKYVGGKFMWPLPQTYVRVSSEYGGRNNPITGKYETHNGIDIPAAYGTDIYASNDGTVTTATNHWSYGNYIMIDHGGGYATLYAHASKLLVKKGDKVKKGQVIAKVGSTGYSTGNHLHFSMYENSAHTDPRKWFPK